MPEQVVLHAYAVVEGGEVERGGRVAGLSHPIMVVTARRWGRRSLRSRDLIKSAAQTAQSQRILTDFPVTFPSATAVPVTVPEQVPELPLKVQLPDSLTRSGTLTEASPLP